MRYLRLTLVCLQSYLVKFPEQQARPLFDRRLDDLHCLFGVAFFEVKKERDLVNPSVRALFDLEGLFDLFEGRALLARDVVTERAESLRNGIFLVLFERVFAVANGLLGEGRR